MLGNHRPQVFWSRVGPVGDQHAPHGELPLYLFVRLCPMMPMTKIFSPQADRPLTQIKGACPHDCPDTCSLLTTVANGVAIKVQGNPAHRHTDGVLCTKVSRYTERTYHPARILQPLKRVGPKGSGQFAPVSWEAALSDIATR